jgi:hypothetical protein
VTFFKEEFRHSIWTKSLIGRQLGRLQGEIGRIFAICAIVGRHWANFCHLGDCTTLGIFKITQVIAPKNGLHTNSRGKSSIQFGQNFGLGDNLGVWCIALGYFLPKNIWSPCPKTSLVA